MTELITRPNIAGVDDIYELLVNLTCGLDEIQSLSVQSKLILLLVNHIGDRSVIEQATRLARPANRWAEAQGVIN